MILTLSNLCVVMTPFLLKGPQMALCSHTLLSWDHVQKLVEHMEMIRTSFTDK